MYKHNRLCPLLQQAGFGLSNRCVQVCVDKLGNGYSVGYIKIDLNCVSSAPLIN